MKKLGFAMCGSFCTHAKAISIMRELSREYDIVPILSFNSASIDTRFGKAEELKTKISEITENPIVDTIKEAEKLGPSNPLDLMFICPCTGNTVSKLAHGISDTPVTLAAKAHLRSDRTLLIALASNDALSANLSNIGTLLNRKNIFFVPMSEDDPVKKPHSLVADFGKYREAVELAENGIQMTPIFAPQK